MRKDLVLTLVSEFLWLIIAGLITWIVTFRLYGIIREDFFRMNILYVFLSITWIRLIVFVHTVPYLKSTAVKILGILLNVIIIGLAVTQLQKFFLYSEEVDDISLKITTFLAMDAFHKPPDMVLEVYHYFKREYQFFNLSVIFLSVLLIFRLIHALWKVNKKK